MKKIILYLLNEKGYCVLNEIIEKDFFSILEYVVVGEDKKLTNDYSNEIKELCQMKNIKFYSREDNIPNSKAIKIAIGWRWLIKDADNLIVLHDSILPKYRGFSPLVNALINGEKEIGVTALFATDEYDKGNILGQKKIKIVYPLKIQTAIQIVSKLYQKLIIEIINKVVNDGNLLEQITQKDEEATYSLWRDEEDYRINWEMNAIEIKRFVDAVGEPYAGAICNLNNEEIILKEIEVVKDVKIESRSLNIGKIIFIENGYPIVVCKQGLIKITKAFYKKNNKNILPIKKFRSRFN